MASSAPPSPSSEDAPIPSLTLQTTIRGLAAGVEAKFEALEKRLDAREKVLEERLDARFDEILRQLAALVPQPPGSPLPSTAAVATAPPTAPPPTAQPQPAVVEEVVVPKPEPSKPTEPEPIAPALTTTVPVTPVQAAPAPATARPAQVAATSTRSSKLPGPRRSDNSLELYGAYQEEHYRCKETHQLWRSVQQAWAPLLWEGSFSEEDHRAARSEGFELG